MDGHSPSCDSTVSGLTLTDEIEHQSPLYVACRSFGPLTARYGVKHDGDEGLDAPQGDEEAETAVGVDAARQSELHLEHDPVREDQKVRGRQEIADDGQQVARRRDRHDQLEQPSGVLRR